MITLGPGARIKSKRHDVIWEVISMDSNLKVCKVKSPDGKIKEITFEQFSKSWEYVNKDSQ